MSRIFLALSLFALAMLGVNIVLGLRIGDYHAKAQTYIETFKRLDELQKERPPPEEQIRDAQAEGKLASASFTSAKERFKLHFLFGLAASLVTVLVNSVCVTYFIGTGRWCREVVEAYGLAEELVERSSAIKRRCFPWSLLGIAVMLAILMLGAAADPSRAVDSSSWVLVHYVAALAGTGFIGLSFLMQVSHIAANYALIDEILAEVSRIRHERGLA